MRLNAHRKLHSCWLRLWTGLCCAVLMIGLWTAASADLGQYLEPERSAALTIRYHAPGTTFRIYRVAAVDETVAFTPVSPFDGYSIDFRRDMTSSEWQALADTLANYAAADGISPLAVCLTGEDGTIRLTDLQAGLYLVVGQGYDLDESIYTITPTLISLPNYQSDGWWQYDVEISPKWSVRPIEREDLQVIKVWKDTGSGANRPASVTVELYCNGVLTDTVILSKDNNWRHTWTALDTRNTWNVVERDVASPYRVSISQQGTVVTVTNTASAAKPSVTPVPSLPQTGQTWWPVPVLAVAGMVLFVLGWLKQSRTRTDMTRHKSRTGVALMTAGVLLILVAIGYVAVNVWEEWSAANASASALDQMESSRATAETPVEDQPLYVQHPDVEMPEVMIDGQAYIGSVSIPKLELELPVISQWTYPRLKLAPCRYSGSVYTDDMIILGHNYERHFRRFTEVETGDEVTFTDMDGNVFRYVVTLKEQIRGNDMERMMAGDWDLTLFTCARGGKMRITLRCDRVDE